MLKIMAFGCRIYILCGTFSLMALVFILWLDLYDADTNHQIPINADKSIRHGIKNTQTNIKPTAILENTSAIKEGIIVGTARDLISNEPVEGIVLQAKSIDLANDHNEETSREGRSNSKGRFRIDHLLLGFKYQLSVAEEGKHYIALEVPNIHLTENCNQINIDLWLTRLGTIMGKVSGRTFLYHPEVIDQAYASIDLKNSPNEINSKLNSMMKAFISTYDKPLPGVQVTIKEYRPQGGSSYRSSVQTDETGDYRLDVLPFRLYQVQVVLPDSFPRLQHDSHHIFQKTSIKPGEVKSLDFFLPNESASFAGRVLDRNGHAIPSVCVTATSLDNLGLIYKEETYGNTVALDAVHTSTNENGWYILNELMPLSFDEVRRYFALGECFCNMYAVTIKADGYSPMRVIAPPFTPQLERAVRSGTERFHQWARLLDPDEAEQSSTTLDVNAPNISFLDDSLLLPDVFLYECATVSGIVENTRGDVLPNVQLRVAPMTASGATLLPLIPTPVVPDWVVTDEFGAFVISDLPSGDYVFEVNSQAEGLQKSTNLPLSIIGGIKTNNIHVVVKAEEKGNIAGTVVESATGKSIDAFKVDASTPEGWAGGNYRDGSFLIENVLEGSAKVIVKADGYADEEIHIMVRGGSVNELNVALSRSGSVQGVLKLDGSLVPGIVKVLQEGDSVSFTHNAWAGKDGKYRIDGLKGGKQYKMVACVNSSINSNNKLVTDAFIIPQAENVIYQDFALQLPQSEIRGTIAVENDLSFWQVWVFESNAYELDPLDSNPFLRAKTFGNGSAEGYHLPVRPGTYHVLARLLLKDKCGVPIVVQDITKVVSIENDDTVTVNFLFK